MPLITLSLIFADADASPAFRHAAMPDDISLFFAAAAAVDAAIMLIRCCCRAMLLLLDATPF